jgi:hypothetical protein
VHARQAEVIARPLGRGPLPSMVGADQVRGRPQLNTGKVFGLEVPNVMRLRADEVIE